MTGRAVPGEAAHGTRIDSPHADAVASSAMREASKSSEAEPSPSSLDGTLEDWHWTWRLAGQGFALFECAAIRRKTMDAILRDLESAVRAGRPFSILDLLDRDAGVAAQKIMDDMLEKSSEQMSAVPAFDSHPLIRRYPSMAGLLRAIAEKTVERSLSRPST